MIAPLWPLRPPVRGLFVFTVGSMPHWLSMRSPTGRSKVPSRHQPSDRPLAVRVRADEPRARRGGTGDEPLGCPSDETDNKQENHCPDDGIDDFREDTAHENKSDVRQEPA